MIMKNLIKYCFIAFLFFTNIACAQKGYYMDKDFRIIKYQSDVISYLIQEQQIQPKSIPVKMADYSGKLFIRKCLDIYKDKANSILLVQFGSLADHADKYWGLLSSQNKFFFYKVDDPEFLKLIKANDSITVATIAAYIRQATLGQEGE
jgi:hypothetical protein